ncbi:MAG: hypothetical protein DLM52_05060 [Chthoniobacterales bacterium]|nr:MAG: hypothetical protein DLM52_05060 [Chthoniobacterales bacterium]
MPPRNIVGLPVKGIGHQSHPAALVVRGTLPRQRLLSVRLVAVNGAGWALELHPTRKRPESHTMTETERYGETNLRERP